MNAEQTKEAAKVMLAAADGAAWQKRRIGDAKWGSAFVGMTPEWNWTQWTYRLAPTHKLVPWTLETVPLTLLWVRRNGSVARIAITSMAADGVMIGFTHWDWDSLTREWQWLRPDGTWGPCGTEVVG